MKRPESSRNHGRLYECEEGDLNLMNSAKNLRNLAARWSLMSTIRHELFPREQTGFGAAGEARGGTLRPPRQRKRSSYPSHHRDPIEG